MGNNYEKLEEDVFYRGDKIVLQCDSNGKIKIKNLCNSDNKNICKLGEIITKLNNIQMSKEQREEYIENIKNICTIIDLNENIAVRKAKELEKNIEQNLFLKKRLLYVFSIVLLFLILIIVFVFLSNKYRDMSYIFICSSLGGILAVLYKQDSYNIDYTVESYIIILESIKRVILTIVVATIGFIIIKADIVLPNFENLTDDYTLALVMIVCGYSINFIPNVLDNIILRNDVEEETSIKND